LDTLPSSGLFIKPPSFVEGGFCNFVEKMEVMWNGRLFRSQFEVYNL
jgi:hypothetical protein